MNVKTPNKIGLKLILTFTIKAILIANKLF